MKNLFKNIYIFSKLSLVLLLFLALIFVSYIFYKSYSAQNKLSLDKKNEDKIIMGLIDQNKIKIDSIGNNIKEINQTLLELKEIEDQNSNMSNDIYDKTALLIDDIKEEINFIKKDLQKIENKNNINQVSNNNSKNYTYNKSIIEILKISKLKFEAGENFSSELELLNFENNSTLKPLVEKLFIIENMKFKGNKTLINIFEYESNEFILENFFKERSLLKNILKHVKVQPSQKNNLYDKNLLSLKNVSDLIYNKKYGKSLNILMSLNSSNEYFSNSLGQLAIAKSFYETIDKIIKNA